MYKKSLLLIVLFIFIINNCYSQGDIGKSLSSYQKKIDSGELTLLEKDLNGSTYTRKNGYKYEYIYFNSQRICFYEKKETTSRLDAKALIDIYSGLAYQRESDNYNSVTYIIEHSKFKKDSKYIAKANVSQNGKFYIFEYYLIDMYGSIILNPNINK